MVALKFIDFNIQIGMIFLKIFPFAVEDIDGGYGDWSDWSSCSVSLSCQRGGVRTRERSCDSPVPQGNGADCPDTLDDPSMEAEGCRGAASGSCTFDVPPAWKPEMSSIKVEGQGNAQSMYIGDWYRYKMWVDFPITTDDKNLVFQMFTNNPDNGLSSSSEPGRTSLTLTHAQIEAYGPKHKLWDGQLNGNYTNADSWTVPPLETLWYHDTGGDQLERKQIKITGINNEGQDGTDNRLIMDYGIFFSNLPSNVYASTSYYVSSGVVVTDFFDEVNILPLLLS